MSAMNRVPFRVGRCWALLPLFMLPAAGPAQGMPWSTLLGGSLREGTSAVAVDDNGHVTAVGVVESWDWPYAPTAGSPSAAFVARLDPTSTGAAQLSWCTMLDGSGYELAFDVAETPSGQEVTVVGLTTSQDLPVTAGAFQGALRGPVDGFVLVLDGTGAITYCSYLGGDGIDWIHAVERDGAGRLVLAGRTTSPSFPTTAGAFDVTFNGVQDEFVTVFDPTRAGAAQLVASTFVGGSGLEGDPFDIESGPNLGLGDAAVAADGSIVLTGWTRSANFPVTPGAFQPARAGLDDIYVARFDAALATLAYSTFLGGRDRDVGFKLALRGDRDVFLAGASRSLDCPTTPGALQQINQGSWDAVLAWLHTAAQGPADLRYASLLGGDGWDEVADLAVEDSGVITAVGITSRGLTGTAGAFVRTSSPRDTLIVRLDPSGNGPSDLHHLSFLSTATGTFGDRALAMARHGDGLITLGGYTDAQPFPTTQGALQPTSNGQLDAFVLTFDPLPEHAVRIGASTPACRGPIWLQVSSDPAPGNAAFAVLGNGAPPGALGVGVVGPVLASGAPVFNATLLVTPVLAVPTAADAQGAWRLPLPLPATLVVPSGLGLQWLWLTAPHCGGSGPLGASHGVGL